MWLGNASKFRIINQISGHAGAVILDYGAGPGSNWAYIFPQLKDVTLYLLEPDPVVNAVLRKNVAHLGNRVHIISEIDPRLRFDYILSFSVFEHVAYPAAYLSVARKHLAANGRFFLNYDDGHFQHWIDLGNPRSWRAGLSGLWARVKAPLARLMGRTSLDLNRHSEAEIEALIEANGFRVDKKIYENFATLKNMFKACPSGQQAAFMQRWCELEQSANALAVDNSWIQPHCYSVTFELVAN